MKKNFIARLNRMLGVDFIKMKSTPMLFIFSLLAFAMPILILVMTSMVGGSSEAGNEAASMSFTSTWQAIGSSGSSMSMDMTSMCNINLVFFLTAIYGALFVGEDFRCGYAKNIFAVRSKRGDYAASKIITVTLAGVLMLILFFIGAMIGGGVAGLPFDLGELNAFNVICCMLSKMFFVAIFASIAVTMSVIGKSRVWLSVLLVLGVGMLLFTMIPMITPLNSTLMNVALTFAGGILFSIGLGSVSGLLLKKFSIL